jgi:hypothetical protein
MYYFCNFIDKEMKGYKKELGFIEVSEKLNESVQPAFCCMVEKEGVKGLNFLALGEKAVGEEIDFIGSFASEKVGSKVEELVSTNDNPIIVVATRKFNVFTGIPSYIKYFPVEGGVIVTLVKGYITVEDSNGTMIPLSRNCDALVNNESNLYTAEDIRKLNILKDIESGLNYSDYVVSDCIISHSYSKDGNKIKSVKFNKENFIILNKEVFIEAKARKEEELRIKAEEKKRRDEEIALFNENYKKRMKDKEEEKKAKKKASSSKTSNKKEVITSAADGAQAFLSIVANLK